MLESMAAGLPIIASQLPAHENFIRHKETGWLADSVESMRCALEWLAIADNNELIAKNARQYVIESVGTWSDCAKRYQSIYDYLQEI